MKTHNNKAWWLVLPVILSVAFSAIMPLMTVVNYSVGYSRAGSGRVRRHGMVQGSDAR